MNDLKESKIKMSGRKQSVAYELYGFIPKFENGKHTAICLSCNRVLQNTAAIRLQKHRSTCIMRTGTGVPVNFPHFEIKRRVRKKAAKSQEDESITLNPKAEQNEMEFEDTRINYNTNDHISYEETTNASIQSRRLPKIPLNVEMNNAYSVPQTYYVMDQAENLNHTKEEQSTDPFQSYRATAGIPNTSALSEDDEVHEISDDDVINTGDGVNEIENSMPCSKDSKQLQDELSAAEIEYYRCKTAYFTKLTDNCKIKRTLMLLQSRKLQLEIEKLTNES